MYMYIDIYINTWSRRALWGFVDYNFNTDWYSQSVRYKELFSIVSYIDTQNMNCNVVPKLPVILL
jgi:hypothetical protein